MDKNYESAKSITAQRDQQRDQQREWLPEGTIIGNYVLRERIAASGIGEVYRAEDRMQLRHAALKILPAPAGYDREQLQALARQIKLQAPPAHALIAELYDTGVTRDGKLFVASAYVNGQSLDVLVHAGAVLDLQKIAAQIALALQVAHEADRLHTDLKLTNLMLTPNGNVRVLDFGLARFKSLWQPLAGTRPSTVRHFSPEHVNCAPLMAASDLFSLGSLLYELITGSAPFAGSSLHEMCAAIACDHPASLAPYAARFEPAWLKAIGKLLDKDLTRRTATAHTLLMELHQPQVTSGRRSAPVRLAVRGPQAANEDWRMVKEFSKGFWQFVFNAGPVMLCFALAILAVIGVGSSLFTLVASAR